MNFLVLAEVVAGVVTIFGALGLFWRVSGIGKMKKRTGEFLDDWNGDEPRPGYTGRKSFPVRMSEVEEIVAQLKRNGGSSVADAVHQAARGIEDLKAEVRQNRQALDRLDERHNHTDQRITDHDKRNREQRELLQQALLAREKELDEKLAGISDDVFRAQAARAILTELGHKLEPSDKPGE